MFKELHKKVSDACCVACLLDFHIQIKCHIEIIHCSQSALLHNWICFWGRNAILDLDHWKNAFENLGDQKDFLTTCTTEWDQEWILKRVHFYSILTLMSKAASVWHGLWFTLMLSVYIFNEAMQLIFPKWSIFWCILHSVVWLRFTCLEV